VDIFREYLDCLIIHYGIKTVLGLLILILVLFLVFKKTETSVKQKLFFLSWFLMLLVPAFWANQPMHVVYFDWRFVMPLVGILLLAATLLSEKKRENQRVVLQSFSFFKKSLLITLNDILCCNSVLC